MKNLLDTFLGTVLDAVPVFVCLMWIGMGCLFVRLLGEAIWRSLC